MIEALRADVTNSISAISVGTVTILSSTVMMELENVRGFDLQSVDVTGVVNGYNNALATVDLDTLLVTLQGLKAVSCMRQHLQYALVEMIKVISVRVSCDVMKEGKILQRILLYCRNVQEHLTVWSNRTLMQPSLL